MEKATNNPAVTVIIPIYNRAHLVGRAIQSVLNQTYQDFGIISVDDGSTDNIEEILMSFKDKRIKYIRYAENKGAAAARNTGIMAVRSKYIAFQDSDDEWLPEKLKKQMKIFEISSPEVGVVYTDMWKITENKRMYFHSPHIMPKDKIIYQQALDYGVKNIGISTVLMKKECFDKVGMFDERLPRYIDLELFIRLSRYFYFYHINEPLLNRYTTNKSISSNTIALVTARKLILNKYFEDIKKNKKVLSNHYFGIGASLCSNKELKNGRHYFIKATKAYPLNIISLLAMLLTFSGQTVYDKVESVFKKINACSDTMKV